MISLIETSEESPFVLAAEHIALLISAGETPAAAASDESEAADASTLVPTLTPAGAAFLEQCAALVAEDKFEAYLAKGIEHLDLVFAKSSEKECECVSTLLVHAVARCPEASTIAAARSLAAALSSKVDDRAEERLTALLNLHGITSRPEVQLPTLVATTEYARRHPRLANILTAWARGKPEQWVTQWALTDAQSRELYLALAALVKASLEKSAPIDYLRLVISALKLAQEGDLEAIAQLKPHAVAAVAEYTRNPNFYQSDLGELPAVKSLALDPNHAPLYKLMTSLLSGDISAFRQAATPEALEQAGFSSEAALYKARMSALLALAAKAGYLEIPYVDVKKALDITEDDQVEAFVVKAVGSKLLEGKIDQVKGTISVTRCTIRSFGPSEWRAVKARLAGWREQLVAVQHNLAVQKGVTTTGGASGAALLPVAIASSNKAVKA